jgi:hypothetical protein
MSGMAGSMAAQRAYPLADMIERLSDEIREASRRAAAADGAIYLKEATIELGWTWTENKEGGIDFQVVRLGAGRTRDTVERMTVSVVPTTDRE